MRRNIRRILRKYGYPADKQEKAIQTVIGQAKLLADELIKGKNGMDIDYFRKQVIFVSLYKLFLYLTVDS